MENNTIIADDSGTFVVVVNGRVVFDGPVVARFATRDEAERFLAASIASDDDLRAPDLDGEQPFTGPGLTDAQRREVEAMDLTVDDAWMEDGYVVTTDENGALMALSPEGKWTPTNALALRGITVTVPPTADHPPVKAGEVERVNEERGIVPPAHDCMDNAVPYVSDGALGHGWECGVCGAFLQAG